MPSEAYVKAIERLAQAFEKLRAAPAVVEVSDPSRRESILRNQNDGELDALARKLKSRLGL